MKRFEIGQKVVALKSRVSDSTAYRQTLTKGKVYTVEFIEYCPTCGIQSINVTGESTKANYYNCVCGNQHKKVSSMITTWSENFAPLDDLEAQIKEAEEKEEYEICQILLDVKEKL